MDDVAQPASLSNAENIEVQRTPPGASGTPNLDSVAKQWTRRPLTRVLFVVVTLVGILLLNRSAGPVDSVVQRNFDEWLSGIEQNLRGGASAAISGAEESGLARPTQEICVEVLVPSAATNSGIATGGAATAHDLSFCRSVSSGESDKLVRLLQLAREGKLFSGSAARIQKTGETVDTRIGQGVGAHFAIREARTTWLTDISISELSGNVKLMSLVKLLEVFTTPPAS